MTSLFKQPLVRLHCLGFVFTPKLIPTICFLALLPFLISLGMWQLDRAAQKTTLNTELQSHQKQAPLTLSQLDHFSKKLQYYPLSIKGHFDNQHQFLIDNKVHNKRAGYDVLTPFIPADNPNKVILVNRGWIAGTGNRQIKPTLAPVSGQVTLNGLIKLPPEKVFLLSDQQTDQSWPRVVQALQMKKLSEQLGKPVYPFYVLQSPKSEHGYLRNWKINGIKSEKHLGYAIQWFSLALTLVIIYIVVNTRRGRK